MIVKRNFNPPKVWAYIQRPMLFIVAWASLVWAFDRWVVEAALALNFTPIGFLGSALAIFVAFRNNAAYGRWWEARQLWGGIVNSCRVLGRLIITFTDSHQHQENYDKTRSTAFKVEMINKLIAWVHALRLQLRAQNSWEELKTYVSEQEWKEVVRATNKPYSIHMLMGKQLYKAMADGTLGGFDSFQMEGQFLALTNYQGGAERIKNTPLPRQYDYFTRLFVYLFAMLLPFGLLGIVPAPYSWLLIPVSLVVAGVFVIMERTGAANENPFENAITDVPMSSICNTIERDLLSALDAREIPARMEVKNGYIF